MHRKTTLKQYYKKWGLEGTQKQAYTIDTIAPFINAIKRKFVNAGFPDIRKKLRMWYQIKAPQ